MLEAVQDSSVSVELYANLILLGMAMLVVVSMVRFHRNEHYKHFNLVDIITCRKGKVSRPAIMEFGAWVVATWGFIVLINKDKLSEWYLGAYIAAFVLRAGHAAYLSNKTGMSEK